MAGVASLGSRTRASARTCGQSDPRGKMTMIPVSDRDPVASSASRSSSKQAFAAGVGPRNVLLSRSAAAASADASSAPTFAAAFGWDERLEVTSRHVVCELVVDERGVVM